MPYIKKEHRTKFTENINNTILTIMRNNVPPMVRIEYFGFFLDRIVNRYMGLLDRANPYNSTNFVPTTRKALEDYAAKLNLLLNKDDMLTNAGEMNYIISSIWWGICGDHPEVSSASYGFRCATRGLIEQLIADLNHVRFADDDQQSRVFNTRRLFVIRGILNDVISEMYRRRTSVYEESKIIENGDIWQDKKLVV